jgi:predicted DsbA family dithiol-disulfide isomerase
MSTPISIEVWSDVVCPWCFIGRRRLQSALAKLPAGQFKVKHRAFQLQPEISGVVKTSEMLAQKYRIDTNKVSEMQANVCSIADGEGLCYDLSDTESGNTRDAHRLLLWAESIGKEDQLLEAMYSGYFEKKKSLFTRDDLIAIAGEVGITADQVNDVLDSNNYLDQVTADQELARQYGASGVPFFVIDNKYGISGAQPQEAFDQTLAAALKERN